MIPSPVEDFPEFYRATHKLLVWYLKPIRSLSKQDLEDVVQETFLEVYRCRHKLQDPKKSRSWLLTIGKRTAFRKKVGQEECFDEKAMSPMTSCPEEEMDTKNLAEMCVDQLKKIKPTEKRQALSMFFLGQCSLKETSESTGIKVSTLTTWCQRFREDLKKTPLNSPQKWSRMEGVQL